MAWFFLIACGAMAVLVLRRAWRSRRPQNVVVADPSNTALYTIGGLIFIGLGAWDLARFVSDPSAYPRLVLSVVCFLIGLQVLTAPRYADLGEIQKAEIAREVARTWWMLPSLLVALFVGFPLLAFIAPLWVAVAYSTTILLTLTAAGTWGSFRLRRIARSG